MKYERLTIKRENGFATARNTTLQRLIDRLAELEDKIERGEIDYIADKDKELARLTAENAALHDRLKKAVELPLLQTIRGNKLPYEVAYKDNNGRIIVTKYRRWQKKQAEARLKELKEEI